MSVRLFDLMVHGTRAVYVWSIWGMSAMLCAGWGFHIVVDDRIFSFIPDRFAGKAELVLYSKRQCSNYCAPLLIKGENKTFELEI